MTALAVAVWLALQAFAPPVVVKTGTAVQQELRHGRMTERTLRGGRREWPAIRRADSRRRGRGRHQSPARKSGVAAERPARKLGSRQRGGGHD